MSTNTIASSITDSFLGLVDLLDLANQIDSVPHPYKDQLTIGELLAVVRLGCQRDVPVSSRQYASGDLNALIDLSGNPYPLVSAIHHKDQTLEGFVLTEEGQALVSGLVEARNIQHTASGASQSRLQTAMGFLESLTPA